MFQKFCNREIYIANYQTRPNFVILNFAAKQTSIKLLSLEKLCYTALSNLFLRDVY